MNKLTGSFDDILIDISPEVIPTIPPIATEQTNNLNSIQDKCCRVENQLFHKRHVRLWRDRRLYI